MKRISLGSKYPHFLLFGKDPHIDEQGVLNNSLP